MDIWNHARVAIPIRQIKLTKFYWNSDYNEIQTVSIFFGKRGFSLEMLVQTHFKIAAVQKGRDLNW